MKIETPFSPGFRISKLDVVVLVAGATAAIWMATIDPWIGLIIGFVVAHFFLFCNVIRMARRFELSWAAIFVVLAGCTITFQAPSWIITYAVSLLATVFLILAQMRQPSYHGVFWKQINPDLPRWWQSHGRNRK